MSEFNISSCENIKNMFNVCENITEINMLEWDMSKIKRFNESSNVLEDLFKSYKKLENIKINFNFNNINQIIKWNKINNSYYDVIIFSEIPKDGTFIYKKKKKY